MPVTIKDVKLNFTFRAKKFQLYKNMYIRNKISNWFLSGNMIELHG